MIFRFAGICCSLLAVPLVARGDPPVASYIFPAGGQRGTTVNVKVGGLNLHSHCGLELLGEGVAADRELRRAATLWFEGPILPLPESQQQEDYPKDMAGRVRIAAGAAPGPRAVRIWTAQGAASGPAFVVGELPEIVEQEAAGPPVAQRVNLPLTINGRIFPREDVDDWSFSARRGETINAEVLAGAFGSPLEAHLELFDAGGRRLAENDRYPGAADARLTFEAPADGEYRIRISDARSLGGQSYVYRLSLTRGARPEAADTPATDRPLPVPLDVHGRIASSGQRAAWPVSLIKGRAYAIDVQTVRIHSPLVPVVTVRDPAGKEAARFDAALQNGEPALRFVPPVDGVYRVEVSERFAGRGGPAFRYRLTVAPAANDADFRLALAADTLNLPRGGTARLKVAVNRLGGFKDPIHLALDGLPAGVTAAPATIAANQAAGEVALKAADDARIATAHVTLRGTATVGDRSVTRTAAAAIKGFGDVDSLLLAVTLPTPFVVKADYLLTQAPRGTVFLRHYRIERNGFAGPIAVSLADRQARQLQGAGGPTLVVPPDRSEFDYPLTMPPWMETGRTCRVCVMAVGEVKDRDGTTHEVSFSSVEQNMQIIVVVEPGRLGLEPERTSVAAAAGGTATLVFTLQRGEGVGGPATIELLPADGVAAAPATLAAGDTKVTMTLRFAKAGIRPGTNAVFRATVLEKGNPIIAEARVELVPR